MDVQGSLANMQMLQFVVIQGGSYLLNSTDTVIYCAA